MPLRIDTIDLNHQGVPQTIAAFLVRGEQPGAMALIETGPESAKQALIDQLAALGVRPEEIKHVLVTHIHFDHAGAAGWWAAQGAHIYVHHVGAPHLIDPSKLVASATRIYGDQMETLWGKLLPVPAEQLTELRDEDLIEIGDLRFRCIDTPGHAGHHHTFILDRVAFTGDVAGVSIPGTPILDLPAPPPEFNLPLWQASIHKLKQFELDAVYPTHFGRAEGVAQRLVDLEALLIRRATLIADWLKEGCTDEELLQNYLQAYQEELLTAGLSESEANQYLVANHPAMSVSGISRYWRKKWAREAQSSS